MKLRLIVLLTSLFYVAWSWAQDSQVEQSEEDPQNSEVVVSETETDSSDALEADAEAEEEAQEDALEDEESPGRFVPTEQISQDLGVSFPVDI